MIQLLPYILAGFLSVTSPDEGTSMPESKAQLEFQEGDIIVQTSTSNQSQPIQLITQSAYSHMGLVNEENGYFYVIEAVQTVRSTPIENWIARGVDGKFAVYRVEDLSEKDAERVIAEAEKFIGKSYDFNFHPSDEQMYCSELVFKAIDRATDRRIGQSEDLGVLIEKAKQVGFADEVERRWGNIQVNYNVITPKAMTKSDKLELIFSNY